MSDNERRFIQRIYKHNTVIYTKCGVGNPVIIDKGCLEKGKGKEKVDGAKIAPIGDVDAIRLRKVKGKSVIEKKLGGLIESDAVMNPDHKYRWMRSSNRYFYPADQVGYDMIEKKWLSMTWHQLSKYELIGSSNTMLIEDIDPEEYEKDQMARRMGRARMNNELVLGLKIGRAMKKEIVDTRMQEDPEFAKFVMRLRGYFGKNADDVYYYSPEDIIRLCKEKDVQRMAEVLSESFKSKEHSKDEVLEDLKHDVSTLSAADLKAFLRRHGYINYELNKKNIEEMIADAKRVQLHLIKSLDRETANILLDSGAFNMPEGYDNRARFFSSQFPSIATNRVIHWMFDEKKGCYLVKRTTGATHALYSRYEVARLTEDDLYEIADIPLYNPANNTEAMDFARFLKIQKRENFDVIDFDNPESIRKDTIAYLRAEGKEMKEILRDQYLCLKSKDVPNKSSTNLLESLTRWFLDPKTFEFVFEVKKEVSGKKKVEQIRFYHPAELNMFTRDDLIKIRRTNPTAKRQWNAYILEMLQNVLDNLISCLPTEKEIKRMQAEYGERKRRQEEARGDVPREETLQIG